MDFSNKNFITYEGINQPTPSRSTDEIYKIFSDMNADVIHMAAHIWGNDTDYINLKNIIDYIKSRNPNIIFISTVLTQGTGYETTDLITGTYYGYEHANLVADTLGGSSTILKDSNAMFQTWNIELESPIKNISEIDDNGKAKVAFVKSIDSETQITTKQPSSITGTNVVTDWNGDTYSIGNYVWKNWAFDPTKYGFSTSKYNYNISPAREVPQRSIWGDINTGFKDLCIHRAQKLIDAGSDGIWWDLLTRNADWMQGTNNIINPNVRNQINTIISMLNDVKNLYPNKNIYHSTWIRSDAYPYLDDLLYSKYKFDYVTYSPSNSEVTTNIPDNARWDAVKNKFSIPNPNNPNSPTPIVAFFDYGSGSTTDPMYHFSQDIIDYQQRHDYQVSFIKNFSNFFKSNYPNQIIWAYPVRGGYMCSDTIQSPCNTKSFKNLYPPGWTIYDSLAPEFDTYSTIKELINPTITTKSSSEAGIGPILVLGLLASGLYLYLKNREKESSKYQYQINSFK